MKLRGMRMATLRVKNSSKGLTLIEVLIALAIISIALTAVIKAASQTIRTMTYLQNKTIALWVGQEVMAEARLGILLLPGKSESVSSSREMLGEMWHWELTEMATPNTKIDKIRVEVSLQHTSQQNAPLISLESYVPTTSF